ncbi:MAG: hypothetical protein JO301_00690 [Chitinophagaceae bacterium]|nr:hypothetical protein [Chitinophagaceae bacterium]
MKKQTIIRAAKRFVIANLLTGAIFLSAHAAGGSFDPTAKAEVKYIGVDKENQLSFKVKYLNPTGSTFSLSVLNEDGETIYKSYYDNKSFDKTFKLPKLELSKLVFLIEDSKNDVKEKYTVNIKTSVQEEVTVSKN